MRLGPLQAQKTMYLAGDRVFRTPFASSRGQVGRGQGQGQGRNVRFANDRGRGSFGGGTRSRPFYRVQVVDNGSGEVVHEQPCEEVDEYAEDVHDNLWIEACEDEQAWDLFDCYELQEINRAMFGEE